MSKLPDQRTENRKIKDKIIEIILKLRRNLFTKWDWLAKTKKQTNTPKNWKDTNI